MRLKIMGGKYNCIGFKIFGGILVEIDAENATSKHGRRICGNTFFMKKHNKSYVLAFFDLYEKMLFTGYAQKLHLRLKYCFNN